MHRIYVFVLFLKKNKKENIHSWQLFVQLFNYLYCFIIEILKMDIYNFDKRIKYTFVIAGNFKNFNINVMQSINIYDVRKFHLL